MYFCVIFLFRFFYFATFAADNINFLIFTDMKKDKIFYTANEVAELLSVSSATVRNWVKSGELDAIRIGSVLRIRKEGVDQLIRG